MSTYRVGRHWGVTIVREDDEDQLVAVVVNGDQALAERICLLLNRADAGPRPITVAFTGPTPEQSAQLRQAILQAVSSTREEFRVALQRSEPVKHQAERRGSDSEGYGLCTACGELWPCASYRGESA